MWEQIRANRMRSAFLVIAMAALLFAVGYVGAEALAPGAGLAGMAVAFVLWLILTVVSYYAGDGIFLSVAGARKIAKEDMPVLYNVVEEMTIASGLKKMPDVYIIDERAPNAFATGRTPDRAAVAVTSGLLRICDRDELQGVIAHEVAHIKNRDTLLMLMAGIMVGAVVILADVVLRTMFWTGGSRHRSRSRGGGQGQAIILLIAIALMILAPLIARLIYFAISRRREYLADASAAVFTRYPEGLASALEKISGSSERLVRVSRATAPMYIINPLAHTGLRAADLTSTHPPISERIRILRSMTGVSFAAYDQAYRGTGRRTSVLPPSALEDSRSLERRKASADAAEKDRARRVGDLLWQMNNYLFLTCGCGTVLKIPPDFHADRLKCPHCSRVHLRSEFASTPPQR
jgi:heat shock protein HtpX